MIDPKEHLLAVIDAYIEATGVPDTTISFRVFHDSKKIRVMRAGASITSARLVSSIQWLSDHWPSDAVWPPTVERPSPAVVEAA